jgi:hypothetical protein
LILMINIAVICGAQRLYSLLQGKKNSNSKSERNVGAIPW